MKPQSKGWTPERRAKQAQKIHDWQPWQHSTGAKTAEGKKRSSQNAFNGAVRPKIRNLKATLKQIKKTTDRALKHVHGFDYDVLVDDAFEEMERLIERTFENIQQPSKHPSKDND